MAAILYVILCRARGGPIRYSLRQMTSRLVALPVPGCSDDVLALQPLAGLAAATWLAMPPRALRRRAGVHARPVSIILVALACFAASA